MKKLLGSHVKADILMYLALRGGCSGRYLAQQLKTSPTPIFKALRQLLAAGVIVKQGKPSYYALNPHGLYYPELVVMLDKTFQHSQEALDYLPQLPAERRVDAQAIYELLAHREKTRPYQKLSDILRERYA